MSTVAWQPGTKWGTPHEAELPRVDLVYSFETPENAILTYQVAGPAERLLAYLIDLTMTIFVGVVGTCLIMSYLSMLQLPGVGAGITLLLWFTMQWMYFTLQEWVFRGKTLGKLICGLRVIMDGGYPLTFLASALRNFLRVADSFPLIGIPMSIFGIATEAEFPIPVFGVALILMAITRDFRRAGDLVARTIVIREGRRELMTVYTGQQDAETIVIAKSGVPLPQEPIILDKITPLKRSEIGGFVPSPKTLALIELFLGRRYALTYRRGHHVAGTLARALAKRLNYEGDPEYVERYPMAFLASVYKTFHRTLDEDG